MLLLVTVLLNLIMPLQNNTGWSSGKYGKMAATGRAAEGQTYQNNGYNTNYQTTGQCDDGSTCTNGQCADGTSCTNYNAGGYNQGYNGQGYNTGGYPNNNQYTTITPPNILFMLNLNNISQQEAETVIQSASDNLLTITPLFTPQQLSNGIQAIVYIIPPSTTPATTPTQTLDTTNYKMVAVLKSSDNQSIMAQGIKIPAGTTVPQSITVGYSNPTTNQNTASTTLTLQGVTQTTTLQAFRQNSPIIFRFHITAISNQNNQNQPVTVTISPLGQSTAAQYPGAQTKAVSLTKSRNVEFSIDPTFQTTASFDKLFTKAQLQAGVSATAIIRPPVTYNQTANIQPTGNVDTTDYRMTVIMKSSDGSAFFDQYIKVPNTTLTTSPLYSYVLSGGQPLKGYNTILPTITPTSITNFIQGAPIIVNYTVKSS